MEQINQRRLANLDLLRTIAILMVVFYHCVNLANVPQRWVWHIAETGSLGVDLFFVLSGFLIGSLYWKEKSRFGQVDNWLFIRRRTFRTVPMYLLIMPLAYLPVYLARSTPFDWKYLFFLQNYNISMPFYVISWSLCIEEHFYLLLPFLIPPVIRLPKPVLFPVIALLLLLPTLLRMSLHSEYVTSEGFGYYFTATHLRYEGLLVGVIVSYFVTYQPALLKNLIPYRWIIYVFTIVSVLSASLMSPFMKYSFSFSIASFAFSLSLCVAYYDQTYQISTHRINYLIAVSSYCIYLVHSLVIHIFVQLFNKLSFNFAYGKIPIMFIACLVVGYWVHLLTEKKLLQWRDRYLPARK